LIQWMIDVTAATSRFW